uniref:Cysteine rich secreted protein n=1 Tax=Riptortus pedestris TaxID=329032 RepID=R4WCN3_RIPPE|nr:cysteine rich secreted protein [Riptortus pedestris]
MSKFPVFLFLVVCTFLVVSSEDALGTYCGSRRTCGGGTFCCDFAAGLCCTFGSSCCRATGMNYCCKQSSDGVFRAVAGQLATEE